MELIELLGGLIEVLCCFEDVNGFTNFLWAMVSLAVFLFIFFAIFQLVHPSTIDLRTQHRTGIEAGSLV